MISSSISFLDGISGSHLPALALPLSFPIKGARKTILFARTRLLCICNCNCCCYSSRTWREEEKPTIGGASRIVMVDALRCCCLLLPATTAVLGAPYYFTSFLSCILSFHHHVFAKRPWRREGLCFPSWNTLEGSSKTSLGSFLQQYLPVRASVCSSSIL